MSRLLKFLGSVYFLLILHVDAQTQEITEEHKDSLRIVVEQYYDLNLKIYQENSSRDDIDNLFDLFTDDFVYVHPRYGGSYSRKDIYDGYINNQSNGSYDGSIADMKIRKLIIGLNGIATDRVYFKKSESGEIEEVDPGMTLFEFRNGKISKIVEYW